MSVLTLAWVLAIGCVILQDALASIWYYRHNEGWQNHIWRVVRAIVAIALIIIACRGLS